VVKVKVKVILVDGQNERSNNTQLIHPLVWLDSLPTTNNNTQNPATQASLLLSSAETHISNQQKSIHRLFHRCRIGSIVGALLGSAD